MHPISEPRLVAAIAAERQRQAAAWHREPREPRGHRRPSALGQLLVRLGERLSSASPGPA